jgi:multicomponent Na+:H+ antiporter subunit A
MALIPGALFVWFVYLAAFAVLPIVIPITWIPSLGIDLTVWVDGLTVQFLLLITGIGTAVFAYGAAYMAGHPGAPRMFGLLVVFLLAMIGCVTTDNLIALVVFWELTSIASFLLVGFKHQYAPARRSAQQALLTTMFGGVTLLLGVVVLGAIGGTYSIRDLIASTPTLAADRRVPFALACVFIGAFTKSAQWPFHFWLPNAMAAPTPVSAYLHSATMVKLGVYLLARLKPAFGHLVLWETTLVTIGAVTAVWAMVLTLRERDLKRILAWSTVAALGTLTLLIGLPGAGAAEATAAFLLAHALYKAPLFFVAGNVDHCTGTRSLDHLAGMARAMPWTALAAALAACSMAGVPLSFGYLAKDLIDVAKTESPVFEWVGYATLTASALTVAVAAVAAVRVFWHAGGAPLPVGIHEASGPMIIAPISVAGIGIVLGVVPGLVAPILQASARAMLPPMAHAAVGLERADAAATVTTAVVFLAGGLIFLVWDPLHRMLASATWLDRHGLASWYDRALKAVATTARLVTTRLQHGVLSGYVAASVLLFVIAVAGSLMMLGTPAGALASAEIPSLAVGGSAGFIVVAALAACVARDPFVMVLVGGLAGIGTAMLTLFLGAPDVAFTQLAVEVAFVVVVAAVIQRLRRLEAPGARHGAGRASLALVGGVVVSTLVLLASAGQPDRETSAYFGARSLADGGGRNVVNVILVDFRAMDTLGEIVVVLFTVVAVLPLMRVLRGRGEAERGGS